MPNAGATQGTISAHHGLPSPVLTRITNNGTRITANGTDSELNITPNSSHLPAQRNLAKKMSPRGLKEPLSAHSSKTSVPYRGDAGARHADVLPMPRSRLRI